MTGVSSPGDTSAREDQMTSPVKQQQQQQSGKQLHRRASAAAPSSAATGAAVKAAPRPSAAAPQTKQKHRSLLERLAAAVALSSFVGALYVTNTIALLSVGLLFFSGFSNPFGWLLLALLLLLASAPLGTGPASRWGVGLPCETHAALASPAPAFGRAFVRYVTGAAGWYFPVRVVVEGEDEEGEEQEKEEEQASDGAAASFKAHARRHATTMQPDGAYMIGLEPHSVLPLAMPACFSTDSVICPRALRGQRVHGLASSVCFSVPLIRHLWWFLGIRPVTRRAIARLITGGDDVPGGGADKKKKKKQQLEAAAAGGALLGQNQQQQQHHQNQRDRRSVVLIPGGVQECLYMQQPATGVETAYLSNRRGFVRLALRCGADALVPAFAFGQSNGLSWARPGPPWFSEAFVARVSRSLGALPLALWGRGGTPAPHRKPMVVVVGRPLPLPRPEEWAASANEGGDPPAELVQAHLEGYIAAMQALVERHRVSAGFPDTTLRVL